MGRVWGRTPDVVIVGGGFGGIAAGVKLKQAGIGTFTICEKSDGIGGTWWENTYPGAEVDVVSHLYSYSFKRNDWTRTHARRDELQRYLEAAVDDYGLRPHFRLGTKVDHAVWDEGSRSYTVGLEGGEQLTCNVLISAVGLLNHPNHPHWPGLEDFEGPKFHTSRWEHQHDLTGKRVAVIGTGSTAVQLVPEIAPVVKQLYLFQREPGWIVPKGERDFTPEERAALRRPLQRRVERMKKFGLLERNLWGGAIYRPGTKVNALREQQCRAYIEREFADRPDLRDAVTPTYHYPGKRPIFHSTFYSVLKRDNVELVPRAVASVTPTGIVDVDGVEREIDVLVIATGFKAAEYLPELEVTGVGGRTIHEVWDEEPYAFLGITVPGFPNFFMLYGPNTNGGEIVFFLERQSEYAVRVAKRIMRGRVSAVEVRKSWTDVYNRWLQRRMKGTSWEECRTYFTAPSGRIVTQWPYGALLYGLLTKTLGPFSERGR
jgi:cation diffusion facilitator CzcD-associated flavoprotein CzcO